MTDRELLELAAKAAGIDGQWSEAYSAIHVNTAPLRNFVLWSPLTDDGDALRLAVALRMLIEVGKGHAIANTMDRAGESTECVYFGTEQTGNSLMTPEAATRRAIVRAAAAIGESK
mgnify:CR=1 FL=1